MSCTNDCRQPAAFPKTIDNRPGLSTIDYRIGSYADLREHMLSRLDASTVLAEWTHRLQSGALPVSAGSPPSGEGV